MATDIRISRRPLLLHPIFVSIGGSLLIAAFASDIMYSQNALIQWSNASEWLIAAGLVLALVGAIALLIDVFAGHRRLRLFDFILLAVAAVLSIINAFVHSRDAWTTVVPEGIWLSGISALLLVIVAVRGWRATEDRVVRETGEPVYRETSDPIVEEGDRA